MTEKNGIEPSSFSPWAAAFSRFRKDYIALTGACGIFFIFIAAVIAPLIANGRPFIFFSKASGLSFPFVRYIFAPDGTEAIVEKIFNFLLIFLPISLLIFLFACGWKRKKLFLCLSGASALLLLVPFLATSHRLEKTDWLKAATEFSKGEFAVMAPVPYGPFSTTGGPYEKPSRQHLMGTDSIGRDVFSRMLYGARVSLAVGFLATGLSFIIGISVGLFAGYRGGKTDIFIMRIIEIIICFPIFLLLLILMAVMMDRKYDQSIMIVILILGFTGWTGLARIVRGETLKQRTFPYILSCEALGLPLWRIMFLHLFPNISGAVLVSFTFSVAEFILAESGLSFLGFGVQAPTASWGELLRQAFAEPFLYWHLTLWPGLALFVTVCSFNFAGEGLRKVFSPKE